MSHRLAESQPPRDRWRVEIVEQKAESGLVLFEYAIREVNQDPFLLNNHKAQIRMNHQRVISGPNGGMMHVSGIEVLDPLEFEASEEFYRWKDKDRSGNWRDDRGRTLAAFVFPSAPWDGGEDEELDPQWQRETFTLSEASQVQECIDRYQSRMVEKGYVGDKRGTTLNLQVGASGDDGRSFRGGAAFQSALTATQAGNSTTFVLDSWHRFTGVSGLSGVTINTASYQLLGQFIGAVSPLTLVYAEDTASPAAPTDTANYNGKAVTASVPWTTSFTNAWQSLDITTVIQELASSYDPTGIQILHKDNGSATSQYQQSSTYDSGSANAAKLDIDYTAASAGQPTTKRWGGVPFMGAHGSGLQAPVRQWIRRASGLMTPQHTTRPWRPSHG